MKHQSSKVEAINQTATASDPAEASSAQIAVIMGSQSDWHMMQEAALMLQRLEISHRCMIISAHRTPERLFNFARQAENQGFQIVIAGAGGAAHLPGMIASMTHLPVFGVPIPSSFQNGLDSLLSIVQMPAGVPVGTLACNKAGASNAALLAASCLALHDPDLRRRLLAFRTEQCDQVALQPTDS